MAKSEAVGSRWQARPSRRAQPAGRRRPGRTLLVLFFAAGIAGLGLLTGGEHPEADALQRRDPMDGYYTSAMPRYPEVQELPAGADTRVGTATTRMSHFSTKDDPAKVADFYEQFWGARGMWVREDVTHKGGYVSAVDPSGGYVYQVVMTAESDGITQVYPSSTASPLGALETRDDPVPLQLFEGSEVLMNMTTKAGPHDARTVLTINHGTVDENMAYYRSALAAAGYTEDKNSASLAKKFPRRSSGMLVYQDAQGTELTVSVTPLDKERTRVHLMQIGAKQ